jgi:hypothetical protein
MAASVKIDWDSRFNTIIDLICEPELNALLACPHLPRYYKIRCLVLQAQCEDDEHKPRYVNQFTIVYKALC